MCSRHTGIANFLGSPLSVREKVFGVFWAEDERGGRSRKADIFLLVRMMGQR